jgi:large subunit ribosomal protein L32
MAVPKRKLSRSRKLKRRAQHDKMSAPTLSSCGNCGEPVRPHHVCAACGHYGGVEVIEVARAEDELVDAETV